ncbi:hypothetical protein ACTG0T_09920 [Halococcus morrhuae DSM 1307]
MTAGSVHDEYEKDWEDRNLPLIHADEADDEALSVYEHWQELNE